MITTQSCVWDDIIGQPRAVSLLRQAASGDLVSHAYLFVGSAGVGKKTAARAFACAILCDDDGCGSCSICDRVKRGAHPDVHIIGPEGAATYLVSQVRDLIHDISLTPAEAARKIYVLSRADSFNAEAANALLKSLEEPPEDVVIILLAHSVDAVLPTVSSRCQVVRFDRMPREVAVAMLMERSGADAETATAALAAAGRVLPRAVDMIRSPSRMAARHQITATLKDLTVMDGADVLGATKKLMEAVRTPLDDLRQRQEEELANHKELMGKTTSTKPLEERHKRELTAREREGMLEILNVTESWLRDCLALNRGTPELVHNTDQSDAMAEVAAQTNPFCLVAGLDAANEARRRISYNVSPQLALEAMLFDIQEVLRCPR